MSELKYPSENATSPEQATVRLERMLPGPIERVWAYLTESDKRETWFAAGVFDMRVGGKADLHFDHSRYTAEEPPPESKSKPCDWTCTITRIEPPRLLAYTFAPGGPESEVTFELETRGNGVLLVLTHRRLADRGKMIGVAGGWDAHVGVLEDRLNGVTPRPFWSTMARLRKQYEVLL